MDQINLHCTYFESSCLINAKAFNPPRRFLIFGVKRSNDFVLSSLMSSVMFDKPHDAPSDTMAYKQTLYFTAQ